MSNFGKLRGLINFSAPRSADQKAKLKSAVDSFTSEHCSQIYTSIELHDSEIAGIATNGSDMVVRLEPAYVHKVGGSPNAAHEGWLYPAEMTIANGEIVEGAQQEGELSNGHLECQDNVIDNLIPVPFVDKRPVKLFFYFVSGEKLGIQGSSIEVKFTGPGKFLESVKL